MTPDTDGRADRELPFSKDDWANAVWSAMRDLCLSQPHIVQPMNIHTVRMFCEASWDALRNSNGAPSDPRGVTATELLAAAQFLEQFHEQGDEGPTGRFERLGENFYRATGYLRPGKDASPASGVSYEERVAAWDKWVADGLATARAVIAKATGRTT